jgi:hypothetical protein
VVVVDARPRDLDEAAPAVDVSSGSTTPSCRAAAAVKILKMLPGS